MALGQVASRLAGQALKAAGRWTAANARRLAQKAADKIIKSYSKRINQVKTGLKLTNKAAKVESETWSDRVRVGGI